MAPKWKYTDMGYQTSVPKKDMIVDVLLHVGHGIPWDWDNTQGYADVVMRPKKNSSPVITERILFAGEGGVTGQFLNDDGESWDIDTVSFIDQETMEDGDERNDDIMIACIEKYIKTLVYADELSAAKDEGFFR